VNDQELGAWLRREREGRYWTRLEMARQLIKVARANNDTSLPKVDNISHNIYRWERGVVGPSERYRHYCCQAFGIPVSDSRTSGEKASAEQFSCPATDAGTARDLLAEGRALLRELGREILVILAEKVGLGCFEVKGQADGERT
jgi:transcriptional regulator with XRE-family HTH domain